MEEAIYLLKKQNNLLVEQNEKLTSKVSSLQFRVDELLRLVHGTKSERFRPSSPDLFSTANIPFMEEELALKQNVKIEIEKVKEHTRTKVKRENAPSREVIPDHFRREEKIIEPTLVPHDAVKIGEEISETLEYKPGELFVKKVVRPKYALADKTGVVIADLPLQPIARCKAGVSLLMRILIDKYVDHLPLHRQIERYARMGMKLSQSTMCDWVSATATLLELLYDKLTSEVLSSGYIGADETPIKVLDPRIRGKTHTGYFWVYLSHEKNLVIFDYDPTRKKGVPGEKLKDFAGYLQSDGYAGYNQFSHQPHIVRLACMAHARRKFEKALDNDRPRAEHAMKLFQRLYRVEQLAKAFNFDKSKIEQIRKRISWPVLMEFEKWMSEQIQSLTPKSPIAEAIGYTQTLWKELLTYTIDGRLQIDNNLVENKIRPVAIGKKNYLFMGSHESGQRTAMLYSFFQSCSLNNINPEEWLSDVLSRIADMKVTQIASLLPNNWKPLPR